MHLAAHQLSDFERDGYVVARGLLSPADDLLPVIDEYTEVLDRVAHRMHRAGEISNAYAEFPFAERAIAITREAGLLDPQPFDISLPTHSKLTPETEFHFGPAVLTLLTNERLLDGVESIIGPEITSNPVQHVRIKPPERLLRKNAPGLVTRTAWHQDNGVVDKAADDTNMLTVWLPLTEATERNGCLTVVPGSYRKGLRVHCPLTSKGKSVIHIPTEIVQQEQVQPLPMAPGDVLFMHRLCMHGSLTNHSDAVRWSLDVRYNPTGQTTGREVLPSFIARSRTNPDSELHDANTWRKMWTDARDHLLANHVPATRSRWDGNHEVCA